MKVEQVVIAPADVEAMNKLQDEMTGISGEMHEELACRTGGSRSARAT